MKSVYLDYPSNEYYVDDVGFAAIFQLVKAHQLCQKEKHPFSEENPCVGRNLCLQHLLQNHRSLTFLDVMRTDLYGRKIYRYLDKAGYIFTSTEDSSDDASKDLDESLNYHGFVPPKTVTFRDRTVEYNDYYATLFGNVNTASVIVMSFDKRGSETVKGQFLLYNDGTHKELAKRGEHKQLFTRSQALLEATKDTEGTYHLPNGSTTTLLTDEDCYPLISQLESAMFDVIRKIANATVPKEEVPV